MACDGKIKNTAPAFLEEDGKKLYFNFHSLVWSVFLNQAPLSYLMFVMNPFGKTLKRRGYLVDPVRFPHAQNGLWQFFSSRKWSGKKTNRSVSLVRNC